MIIMKFIITSILIVYISIVDLSAQDNLDLFSGQISIKNEDSVELVKLSNVNPTLDYGGLQLFADRSNEQEIGALLQCQPNHGGELILYNANELQRARLQSHADGSVNSARLTLEGVSDASFPSDGVAQHLIELINDRSDASTFDDHTFFIGVMRDINGFLMTDDVLTISHTTGGAEPTNSDIIAKIDQNGTYTTVSDRRLKENIRDLGPVLTKLMDIVPSHYNFKSDPIQRQSIGFIAQNLQKSFPHLVTGGNSIEGDHLMVNYMGMIPVLTKAVQEQQVLIELLSDRLNSIESKSSPEVRN